MSADTNPTLSVVIPALNEEASIGDVVRAVHERLDALHVSHQIIVVNDGSRDNTGHVAKEAGAEIVTHREPKGYGASLKAGVRAASAPWILIMDGDASYPPAEIENIIAASSDQDVVIGARTKQGSKIPFVRRPMKWLLTRLAERLSGKSIPDLNSGMRLFSREDFLRKCPNMPNGFSLSTTHTLLSLSEFQRVRFVPIDYESRAGQSKFHPIRDTWGMIMLIIKTVMMFDPMRVFLPISLVLLLAAIAVAICSYTFLERFLDTTFVVLLFASLQFFALGLLADLINRRR